MKKNRRRNMKRENESVKKTRRVKIEIEKQQQKHSTHTKGKRHVRESREEDRKA